MTLPQQTSDPSTGANDAYIASLIAGRTPGHALAQPFYTDPRVFTHDMERVFFRYWLYVGHASQIPRAGDYFLYTIAGESLVITRGADGSVHALANVCRHRGSRVCTQPRGHAKRLTCPYHHWTYGSDGTLLAALDTPDGFDPARHGLKRHHVRDFFGLIFVSLADEPHPFDCVENDIGPYLAPHGVARARIAHTAHYDVHANWKVLAENFRECYHCPPAHPEYCRVIMAAAALANPRLKPEYDARVAERETHWKSIGLKTDGFWLTPQTWHHCYRYVLSPGYVTQSEDGQPLAPIMGDIPERDQGALGMMISPTFTMEVCSDFAVTMRFTPVNAALTHVDLEWLVHPDAVERRDYNLDRLTWLWRCTGEQDWAICQWTQQGVASRDYTPGPYSKREDGPEVFVRWYLDQIR